MTDSPESTDNGIGALLRKINKTLRQFFDVRRQRAELKLDYDKKSSKLTKKFETADAPLATLEEELAIKLRALVVPNRAILLTGTLKSFATHFGKVSFKEKNESWKITNPAGIEAQARKDGWLKKLGKFKRTWSPDAKAVVSVMNSDPKAAKRYSAHVEKTGGYDELSVKPNDIYLTDHDPDRLTEPSVNLGQVPNDVKDESPDA